jgi:hypothetical protein
MRACRELDEEDGAKGFEQLPTISSMTDLQPLIVCDKVR